MLPSVTFSFNFGSVGFPFADGMFAEAVVVRSRVNILRRRSTDARILTTLLRDGIRMFCKKGVSDNGS